MDGLMARSISSSIGRCNDGSVGKINMFISL